MGVSLADGETFKKLGIFLYINFTYTCLELLSGRNFFPTFENIFVLENVFLLVLRTRFCDLNLILKD